MLTNCPNPGSEGCPYFECEPRRIRYQYDEHGCHADTDHIVPKRLGKTRLTRAYISSDGNKQQLCRWLHDQKSKQGDEPLPTVHEMIIALTVQLDTLDQQLAE